MKSQSGQYEEFASSVDLDGIVRTVESKNSVERLFWVLTILVSLILSLYFTYNFVTGYMSSSPFSTNYDITTMGEEGNGLVPYPDLLICTSSPWDMDKIRDYNISMDLVSYMTKFLFPFMKSTFEGIGLPTFNILEDKYNQLINKRFDGNAMNLLKNITFSCEKMIDFCLFGFNTYYTGQECCQKFFKPVEFGFVFMCLRSNEKLAYTVQEPGILTGVMIGLRRASFFKFSIQKVLVEGPKKYKISNKI